MRIIALGDSLTVGESDPTFSIDVGVTFPEHLEALAQHYLEDHASSTEIRIVNKGMSGDLTSGMLERFNRDVIGEEADYVIILGGTNDIGGNMMPSVITDNLVAMYDSALTADIGPVACGVPSILGVDELIPPRLRLNKMMQAEASKRDIPFVDLFSATADPQTRRLSEQYSADGLHLNSQGYRRIGQSIFDTWLRPLLAKSTKSNQ